MNTQLGEQPTPLSQRRARGHHWGMIVCCIPMLVIAVVLVATGVAGVGFIVAALVCTAMMALMMQGMGGDDQAKGGHHH